MKRAMNERPLSATQTSRSSIRRSGIVKGGLLALLASLLALSACGGRQVPDAIPDTPEARAILDLLASYRAAMEAKDVDSILAIASRDYHDPMGSPDPGVDIYYHDLEEKLSQDFEQVRAIGLDIEVLRIDFPEPMAEDDPSLATVSYRYDVRYQISMPSGEKWHNALEVNQMLLRREPDGGWLVLSGL